MKNNLKINKIIRVVLIILLLFATKVYAVSDIYSVTMSTSVSPVKRGSSVTITIGLADIAIESGEKGICAYTAEIEFDDSVFEYDSSSGTSKWEKPFYQDGLITGNTEDGEVVNTTQSIGTITFKVKDNAKLGETTISLINFSGSTAENDITTPNKSVKIVIEDKSDNSGNNNSGNTGNNNNGNTGNNNGSGNNNNGNTGNNNGSGNNNNGNTENNNGSGNNNNGNSGNNNGSGNNNNGNTGSNNDSNNNSNNDLNTKPTITNEVIDNSVNPKKPLPKTGISNVVICVGIGICGTFAINFFIKWRLTKK